MKIKSVAALAVVVMLSGCSKLGKIIQKVSYGSEIKITLENDIFQQDFIKLKDGSLIVVFSEGKNDNSPGTQITLYRSEKNGKTQKTPLIKTGWSAYNPKVAQLQDGLVIVVFNQSRYDRDLKTFTPVGIFIMESYDNCKTFTAPRIISSQNLNVSGSILEIDDGTIIIPVYSDNNGQTISILKSVDRGITWAETDIFSGRMPDSTALTCPAVVKTSGGEFICLMQQKNDRFIFQSISDDNGKTWSVPARTNLEGTMPGLSVTPLGSIKAVFKDMWPEGISSAVSYNNGIVWEDEKSIKNTNINCKSPVVKNIENKIYFSYIKQDSTVLPCIVIREEPCKLPVSPGGLSASVTNSSVCLRWNEVDEADYYVIYRDTTSLTGRDITDKILCTVPVNHFTDKTGEGKVQYFYAVSSVVSKGRLIKNTGMESRISKEIKVETE